MAEIIGIRVHVSAIYLQVLFSLRGLSHSYSLHVNNSTGLRVKGSFKVIQFSFLQHHPLTLPAREEQRSSC